MKQFHTILLFALLGLTHAGIIDKCEIGLFDCVKKPIEITTFTRDDCKCRLSDFDQINEGAKLFPWVVSIIDSRHASFCSGNIINHDHILTAARCVNDSEASEVKVQLQIRNRYDLKVVHKVKEIIRKGNENTEDVNDIAILKLAKPIEFIENQVQPACLNFQETNYTNQKATSGRGLLHHTDKQKKKHPSLKLEPIDQECVSNKNLLCTDTVRMCLGDSGVAMLYGHDGKVAIEGVAAKMYHGEKYKDGYTDCTNKIGFALLSYYKDWVGEIIGDNYCDV